jgi:hypothetical protein
MFIGETELEKGAGLLINLVVVPLGNTLAELKDFSPLLEDRVEFLTPPVDFSAIILKDV